MCFAGDSTENYGSFAYRRKSPTLLSVGRGALDRRGRLLDLLRTCRLSSQRIHECEPTLSISTLHSDCWIDHCRDGRGNVRVLRDSTSAVDRRN